MDYKYIEQLLDRYFAAETTLQEEQILHAFFGEEHADMPRHLAQYAPLFTAMDKEETLGDDFDERLLAMTEESSQQPTVVKARVVSLAQRLRPLFGAAAVVAIFLTLGNAINQSFKNNNTEVSTEEYAGYHVTKSGDPAMANNKATAAMDSLTMVGDKLSQTGDTLKALGID